MKQIKKSDASEDLFHLGVKALVRNDQGEILLLQFNPVRLPGNVWDLPGGRIKQGEQIEAALRREVLEELGPMPINVGKHVGMMLSKIRIPVDAGDVGLVLSAYECTIPASATIQLSDDHERYGWFAPSKAAEMLQHKFSQEFCNFIAQLR